MGILHQYFLFLCNIHLFINIFYDYYCLPDHPVMSSFNIRSSEIALEANGSGLIELGFLPFNLGQHNCTVIFVNEKIGEFLYAINATSTPPLPAHVPYTPGGARISNSAAAGKYG